MCQCACILASGCLSLSLRALKIIDHPAPSCCCSSCCRAAETLSRAASMLLHALFELTEHHTTHYTSILSHGYPPLYPVTSHYVLYGHCVCLLATCMYCKTPPVTSFNIHYWISLSTWIFSIQGTFKSGCWLGLGTQVCTWRTVRRRRRVAICLVSDVDFNLLGHTLIEVCVYLLGGTIRNRSGYDYDLISRYITREYL